jgi:hypothetical protein
MGMRRVVALGPTFGLAGCLLLLSGLTGCQSAQPVSVQRLIAHQALIDFSGLKPLQTLEELKVAASVPEKWQALPLQKKAMFAHQQWRSPSRTTGVGVAYIHLPLPVTAKTIIWFAKLQYAQQNRKDAKPQGRLLGEWTDSIGREWFEAENEKYHIRGYAVTNGFDAWVVYTGYRVKDPINLAEYAMASRSMDTIIPTPLSTMKNSATATASAK